MPSFYQDVEAEVDIDINEFLSACSIKEIKELTNRLIDDGHLKKIGGSIVKSNDELLGSSENSFNETIYKIQDSYLEMSKEDLETLINISKKYRY